MKTYKITSKTEKEKNFRLQIKGEHYLAGGFSFSTLYGRELSTYSFHDLEKEITSAVQDEEPFRIFGEYKGSSTAMRRENMLPFSVADKITKEVHLHEKKKKRKLTREMPADGFSDLVEYYTEGKIETGRDESLVIEYGEGCPVYIHISPENIVTVINHCSAFSQITFEEGTRSMLDTDGQNTEGLSYKIPIQASITTHSIKNNMTENGGTLDIDYSIEVCGGTVERTSFALTAKTVG